MILVEKIIETAIRPALRTSINEMALTVPQLQDCKIIGDWLAPEESFDNDETGMRVSFSAQPNSSEGYYPNVGFPKIRTVVVTVQCITNPNDDLDNTVANALYEAVRSVFEAATLPFTFATGVTFGGMLISGGGSDVVSDVGKVRQFDIQFMVTVG